MLFIIETESFVVEACSEEEAERIAALEMQKNPNVPMMNAIVHEPDNHGDATPDEIWTAEKISQHQPPISCQ